MPKSFFDGSDPTDRSEVTEELRELVNFFSHERRPVADIDWVRGWGCRLGKWFDNLHLHQAWQYAWMFFLPDAQASNALMRLSVNYPFVVKQIDQRVDEARLLCQKFGEGDKEAKHHFLAVIESLISTIRKGTETIEAAEKSTTQRHISKRRSGWTKEKLDKTLRAWAAQSPTDAESWSRERIAAEFGCAASLISSTAWWQNVRRKPSLMAGRKPRAVGLTPAAEKVAQNEAIEGLRREQERDARTGSRGNPVRKRL